MPATRAMPANNMMQVEIPIGIAPLELAENVVRSVFDDAGQEHFGFEEAEEDGRRRLLVSVPMTADDELWLALGKAQDEIAARAEFGRLKVPESVLSKRETVVVNMFGGPGAGKTTAAFEVAEKLKKAGYVVEYAPEYAKELVWTITDENTDPAQRALAKTLLDGEYKHQEQLYNRQLERIRRCVGQCDFVVTDSPPALSALYLKPKSENQRIRFEKRVLADMADFTNFNLFVKRAGKYEQSGRVHDEAEAAELDGRITAFLDGHGLYYGTYSHNQIDQAIKNMTVTYERCRRRQPQVETTKAQTGNPVPSSDREATSEEKGTTMAENNKEGYEYVFVPKTGYHGRESIYEFPEKVNEAGEVVRKPLTKVTLPPHMPPVKLADGTEVDISNHTFLVRGGVEVPIRDAQGQEIGVRKGSVASFANDPNYYQVSFPTVNKDGKPWEVNLQQERGHWENPGAETPEARGNWIKDDPVKVSVPVSEMRQAMQEYREQKREYKQERYEQRQKNRVETPSKPEKSQEASMQKDLEQAKHASAGSARTAPAQMKTQVK